VSPNLPAPQIYLSKDPDPAEERSDHASFQLVGYPACVTSEDFFAGPRPGSPKSEANPNYHKKGDTFVDPEYAADIARAVAAAAWATANR
jgi:bacterial leucyl aminopeptidase